jgi:hypothetical protein
MALATRSRTLYMETPGHAEAWEYLDKRHATRSECRHTDAGLMGYQLDACSRALDQGMRFWRALQEQYHVSAHDVMIVLDLFTVRDSEPLAGFLSGCNGVASLLREAHGHLTRQFPDAEFRLELVNDPEAEDVQYVAVDVLPATSYELALEQLEAFDAEWWDDALPRSGGIVTIDIAPA